MADRGRDLKVAILSDADRFDLAKPADQLDDLATAASHADRALDRLDTDRTAKKITDLGIDAKDTARKVDDAFDAIARSSKTAAGKVGADTSTIKRKLGDVADEAKDTARETAASLANFGGDLASAGQEIAANAGALFGPVGLAIGAALSAGIAIFQQKAEELRVTADAILSDMLESAGKISQKGMQSRLQAMGLDILRYKQIALDAKIPVEDFLAAVVGDPGAIARTTAALDQARSAYAATLSGSSNAAEMLDAFDAAARRVTDTLGTSTEAAQLASDAYRAIQGATSTAARAADRDADLIGQAGRNAGRMLTEGIAAAEGDVGSAARRVHAAAARELAAPVTLTVTADTSRADASIAAMKRRYAAMDLRFMP